jgi:hypothetical protein
MSVASPNPAAVEEAEPVTQGSQMQRKNWPIWMQQFPYGSIKKPDDTFQLIDPATLQTLLANENPEAVKRIQDDIAFLDYELLRLFRERDYEAKANQNRYRLYQIGYMLLAALATLFGSLLALSIQNSPEIVPVFSFLEFTTALGTTYLSTISGRDAPLQKWLTNRHKAEALRREYFRYLLNLAPYDGLDAIKRRRTLSQRAASFNLTGTIEPG